MLSTEAARLTEDPSGQVEALLDRAIELLVSPTLENLRSVEEVLREAVVRMPEPAAAGRSEATAAALAGKVRLCGRLLASAEAVRPGFEAPAAAYDAQGLASARPPRHHQLDYEA